MPADIGALLRAGVGARAAFPGRRFGHPAFDHGRQDLRMELKAIGRAAVADVTVDQLRMKPDELRKTLTVGL